MPWSPLASWGFAADHVHAPRSYAALFRLRDDGHRGADGRGGVPGSLTMWGGSIRFTAPMHWGGGPRSSCSRSGGVTGVGAGKCRHRPRLDTPTTSSRTFHDVLARAGLRIFAGNDHRLPEDDRRRDPARIGSVTAFRIAFIGSTCSFSSRCTSWASGHAAPLTPDHPDAFAGWHFVASMGAWIFAAGLVISSSAASSTPSCARRGAWRNWREGATTLEWTLPSPPPFHQFENPPRHRHTHH